MMHSQVLNALMGVLALAVMVTSAPALSHALPDVCDPTTVFVTISSLSTVTSYQATKTVYVALPCTVCSSDMESSTPTTTSTRVNTLTITSYPEVETVYLTTPGGVYTIAAEAATTKVPHQVTITETTVLVITDVQLTPLPSGGSLTYSETAASNGLLEFVVENGTTYWLNGQTPAPGSYAVETSVVTVVPYISASTTADTGTVTLHTTVYSTQEFTITESLSTPTPTNRASGHVGTGTSFTGVASGGWNASSTTRSAISVLQTGAVGYPTTRTLLSLSQDPSFTLATTFSIMTSTSLAAQAGFNAASTSSAAGSSLTAIGAYSFSVPPYANTTSPASRASAPTVSASSTGSGLGTAISSASGSFPTSSSFTPSQATNSTTNASSPATVFPLSGTPSVTSSNQISTSTASTASATPDLCGEHGDFTLNFDDIPPLSIGNENPNDVQPEPVFNPYHQFDFSDGFTVVPPPTVPYLPSSKPLFIEFVPDFNINGTNPNSGPNTAEYGYSGDIGNGDHGLTGCFGFNAYGASFGCDSRGPDCDFHFTGFRYDRSTGNTTAVTSQAIAVPACPALKNCALVSVTLDSTFKDLDSIRINVTVASAPKIWWMDDLRLGWYNNSCTTGLCRQETAIH